MPELTSTSSARLAYHRVPSTEDLRSPENQNFNENFLEESPFLKACRDGNADEVKKYLKDNAELAGRQFTSTAKGGYYYPLHVAAQEGHVDIITILCDHNINVNVNDITDDGSTALHIASLYGHVEAVKELIKQSATTDHLRHDNASPLSLALVASHFDVSELLLDASADKNPHIPTLNLKNKNPAPLIIYLRNAKNWQTVFARKNQQGNTPLDFAACQGHVKTVDFLLTHGADANHKDNYGRTALHQAAYYGHCEVIRAIMRHNPAGAGPGAIDVSSKDNDEQTPLTRAYLNNHHDAVEALKELGADPNVELSDIKKNPLLDSADWKNSSKPLHIAAQNGHLEKVRKIIKRGESIDNKDNSGSTALSLAFRYGHFHVTEVLLKAGAIKPTHPNHLAHLLNKSDSEWKESFNEKNDKGLTALGVASLHNLHRTGEMLIQFGAEPNVLMEDGSTPLHISSINGSYETAKVLIDAGATVDHQRQLDKATPLSLAFAKKDYAMTELFLNKDPDNKLNQLAPHPKYGGNWKAHFNEKNDHDHIDLFDASGKGYARTVEVMLNYGIDANATDKDGHTALHFASGCGEDKVIRAILEHDSVKEDKDAVETMVNKPDNKGITPLMNGIIYAHPNVVRLLIEYGTDTRQKYTYKKGKESRLIPLHRLANKPKARFESELAGLNKRNKRNIDSQKIQATQEKIKNYNLVIEILKAANERDDSAHRLI